MGALVNDLRVIQNKIVTNKVVVEEKPGPSISVLAFTYLSTDPVPLYIN